MQRAQLRAGLDAQLLDEDATGVGERGQRLRLPPGPVQRQHQLPAEPLPERVRADQLRQLPGRLGRPAELEQDVDVLLGGGQPLLAEPGPDDLRPRAGNAVERDALPQPPAPTRATPPPRPGRPPGGTRGPRPAVRRTARRRAGRVPAAAGTPAAGQQHLARRPVRPPAARAPPAAGRRGRAARSPIGRAARRPRSRRSARRARPPGSPAPPAARGPPAAAARQARAPFRRARPAPARARPPAPAAPSSAVSPCVSLASASPSSEVTVATFRPGAQAYDD